MPRKTFTDDELKARLTPAQYEITQNAGTEPPFTGIYNDAKDAGVYRCIVCDEPLFESSTKYESGSGWPSFWQPIDPEAVELHQDRSYGMVRTEVNCATCGAHLGHVFPDGPHPTGERYCMNSASLNLEPADKQ
jgi:peptide-methionine (R)-S-oxide reductase